MSGHDLVSAVFTALAIWAVASLLATREQAREVARSVHERAVGAMLGRPHPTGEPDPPGAPHSPAAPGAKSAGGAKGPGAGPGSGGAAAAPGGPGVGRAVAVEIGANLAALALAAIAATGYAMARPAVRAAAARWPRRPIAPPASGPAPRTAGAITAEPDSATGEIVDEIAAPPAPDADPRDAIADAQIVEDPNTPRGAGPAPQHPKPIPAASPKGIAVPDSDIAARSAPAETLSQVKTDMRQAADAGAALASSTGSQSAIAAARAQSAQARAQQAQQLAEAAALAAQHAAASAEYAAANRVDAASVTAIAAVSAQATAISNRAAAAAQVAAQIASLEQQLAEIYGALGASAGAFAEAAANARTTIAAHQDPHRDAALATGHEGATFDYAAG